MHSPKPLTGWQFEELRKFLESNKDDPLLDRKAVLLLNPEDLRSSDGILLNHFWPAILRAISGTPLRVIPSPDSDLASKIQSKPFPEASRELMFVLQDPQRPIASPQSAPWYLRGCVECSPLSYMLSYEVFIYFPTTFSMRRLIKLLANPAFSSNPPTLSYEGAMAGPSVLVAKFVGGSGASWPVHGPEVAAGRAEQMVGMFIGIAAAVYVLERDFSNARMLGEVTRRLLALHRADEI